MFQAFFSAHHQELKNCTHNIGYMSSWLVATSSVGEARYIPDTVCTVFELLMMGGKNRLKHVEHWQ